jgi:hypothetical protein
MAHKLILFFTHFINLFTSCFNPFTDYFEYRLYCLVTYFKIFVAMSKSAYLKIILAAITAIFLMACNRQQTAQLNDLKMHDSLMMRQMQQKDSSLHAYIRSIDQIQGGIDTIMMDARMLKVHKEDVGDTNKLIEELRDINGLVLRNQKALAALESKLKKSQDANQDLVDLGENLSKQLNEKDSEIAVIQKELVSTKASLSKVVNQFNDSLNVIMQQRTEIGLMKIEGNTVYYIMGTEKDLMNRGIIINEGGVIGLGHVSVANGDMSTAGFTRGDLTNLHEIPLSGQFVKFITVHPSMAYKITSGASGKIIITDPQDFWSKSKYMIAIVR